MKWFLRRAKAMIPVIALAAATVGGALAQVQRPMTVAVLNFSNSSGYGGTLLGNRAAAAVESQMIESGRYDVVKRTLVNQTMEDLNLSYPLGRTGLQQLATRLEADAIVTGDVMRVIRDSKTNQVRVTLRIEMTDRSSGELINGAISTGESGIRPDFSGSEDILLDEALNRTAFSSVRTMNDRILPEGTVFATSAAEGKVEALLNIGSNSGVRPGMEFIVLRNREQVGRLRASRVSPTDSTAAVVSSTRGVQPEDKVRAVFRLENIPVDLGGTGGPSERISRPKMKMGNLALGALALFGLYKVTQGHLGSGTPGVRNATAVATGPNNGAPGANTFPFVPAIRVRWRPPVGVASGDMLGYAVYRVVETGTARPVRTLSGATAIREVVDDGFAYDVAEFESQGETPAFGSGKVDGLTPGVLERYLIRTAYFKNTTDTGGGTGGGTGGTTNKELAYADEVLSSQATALLPPVSTTVTATNGNVSQTNFTFTLVPGGDRYVIQVADNPGFTNPDTYPKNDTGLVYSPPLAPPLPVRYWGTVEDVTVGGVTTSVCTPATDGDAVCGIDDFRYADTTTGETSPYAPPVTVTVDLNQGRLDPPSPGRQLYWRAGVRSSRDDNRPENGGFVWGDIVPLNIAEPGTGASKATKLTPPVVVPPTVDKPSPITIDPGFSGMKPGAGRNTGRGR